MATLHSTCSERTFKQHLSTIIEDCANMYEPQQQYVIEKCYYTKTVGHKKISLVY